MKRIIGWAVLVCGVVLWLPPSRAAEGTGQVSRSLSFNMQCPSGLDVPVPRALYVFDPALPENTTGILGYTLDYSVDDAAVLRGLQLDWDWKDEDMHYGQDLMGRVDNRGRAPFVLYDWTDTAAPLNYVGIGGLAYITFVTNDAAIAAEAVAEQKKTKPDTPVADTRDPVNVINGALTHDETDLAIPCPGPSLVFRRGYNSQRGEVGALGYGWRHSFEWKVSLTNLVYTTPDGTVTGSFAAVDAGDEERFLLPETGSNTWSARRDVPWTLILTNGGSYGLDDGRGGQWTFGSDGLAESLADAWNNRLTFVHETNGGIRRLVQVQHSNGLDLDFEWQSNRLSAVRTPSSGLSLLFEYNAAGELTNATRQTTGGSYFSAYTYDAGGHHELVTRVNPAGERSDYGYETNTPGWCKSVLVASNWFGHTLSFDVSNATTTVSYDHENGARELDYYYDPTNRKITRIEGPADRVETFTRDPMGMDLLGHTVEDAAGTWEEVFGYDQDHNLLYYASAIDASALPRTVAAWDPVGGTPTYMSDASGATVSVAPTNGEPASVTVDPYGDPLTSEFTYLTNGLPSSFTDPDGRTIEWTYDAYGRATGVQAEVGPSAVISNDVLGHVCSITMPGDDGPRTVLFDLNELGWLEGITWPDAGSESFQNDGAGRVTNHVDRAGRATRMTWLPSGRLQSVSRTVGGSNAVVTMSYDRQMDLARVTDALGRVVEGYAVDSLDRTASVTNMEGQVLSVTYGAADLPASVVRFDGETVDFDYDSSGRPTRAVCGALTNSWVWRANGQLATAGNEEDVVNLTYDAANRLVSVSLTTDEVDAVQYGYDGAGNLTGSSTPFARSYGYDAAGRRTNMGGVSGDYTWTYNTNNGQVATVAWGTNVVAYYGYDSMDRVTSLEYRTTLGQQIAAFAYAYDISGLITQRTTTIAGYVKQESFSYDELGRLVQASGGPAGVETWEYDLAGNRTARRTSGASVAYQHTAGDRMTGWTAAVTSIACEVVGGSSEAIGLDDRWGELWVEGASKVMPEVTGSLFRVAALPVGSSGTQAVVAAIRDAAGNMGYATNRFVADVCTNGIYSYDAAGNVTNIEYRGTATTESRAFVWNARGELLSATLGAETESYQYDALGRRTAIMTNSVGQYMAYEGPHVAEERDSEWTYTRSYDFGPEVDWLLGFAVHTNEVDTGHFRCITDIQGTVHAIVDESGTIVERYEYDAWGRVLGVYDGTGAPLQRTACGNRYLFQGREYSWVSGLYYFRARWYDPVTGRWMSKDPIGIGGGLNQYVFCGNNAVICRDPFGLCEDAGWGSSFFGLAASVLDFILPDARLVSLSASGGALFGASVGGQIVENYRSGEVSLFAFHDVSCGWQAGDASYFGGMVWDLPANAGYSGGSISAEGGAWILGGSLFIGGNSGMGPGGGRLGVNWSGPKGFSAGPSLAIPGGRVAVSEFSEPMNIPVSPGIMDGMIGRGAGAASAALRMGHALRRWCERRSGR